MEKRGTIKEKIKKANLMAVERMLDSDPVWVDVGRAGGLIPRMAKNLLLHAGPPQEYKNMCGPQRVQPGALSSLRAWQRMRQKRIECWLRER